MHVQLCMRPAITDKFKSWNLWSTLIPIYLCQGTSELYEFTLWASDNLLVINLNTCLSSQPLHPYMQASALALKADSVRVETSVSVALAALVRTAKVNGFDTS